MELFGKLKQMGMGGRSLQFKILCGIILSLVTTAFFIVSFAVYTTQDYLQKDADTNVKDRYAGITELFDIYKTNAQGHANAIAKYPQLVEALKQRDTQALFAVTTPLMKESHLDYMVITDPKGHAIIRTHEPGVIPKADDSIANQMNVAQAMQGKSFVGIEEGKVVKLSVRAGSPIYDHSGSLIGTVSTGYVISQNEIVDRAKKMLGMDFTLFLKDQRVASTLISQDGKRDVGSAMDEQDIVQTVISDGKIYSGEKQFNGMKYTVAYGPLIGARGEAIGMVGVARSTSLMEEISKSLTYRTIGVALAALFIVTVFAVIFIRRLLKPLQLILEKIMQVAAGNLTVSVLELQSQDEIGRLAAGFNTMLKSLRSLIQTVSYSAQQVAASSEELNASADQTALAVHQVATVISDVSDGTTKQLKAVDHTTMIVKQMSDGMQKIAGNVRDVTGSSEKSAIAAQSGSSTIEAAVKQMAKIEATVNRSALIVGELGDRSRTIGQIVDTISGIAEQTNLLALNAAIEAARAGERGRGFSVVADEVRKLAEQSQQATKQIAELIAQIKTDTNLAVTAMAEGTADVQRGAEVVNLAGENFQTIYQSIDEVSRQIQAISTAANEMASGSQQIVVSTKAIDDISKVTAAQAQTVSATTEEQSATMEEIAASSQMLAKLATELTMAVHKFKI